MKKLSAIIPTGVPAKVTLSNIPFPLNVLESSDDKIHVEILGDEKLANEIKLEQDGNKVKIFGTDNLTGKGNINISNSNISISSTGNTTIISSRSINIGSGKIIVDGIDVSDYVATQKNTDPKAKVERVDVYLPKGCHLKLSRLQKIIVGVDVSVLAVSLGGNCEFDVTGEITEAELDLSGQANGKIRNLKGGSLVVSTSGQSSVHAVGSFSKVKVGSSGQSSVFTTGIVSGDYTVNTSGQSNGSHSGKIEGDFDKDCSGQSSFRRN